jgi:predicted CoA-binding protein
LARGHIHHSITFPNLLKIVDTFRHSEYVPVDAAIRKNAKVIWMQEAVDQEAAAARGTRGGG